MGQLRNATAQDRSSFPGCDFAAIDAVPLTQCEDSTISGTNGITTTAGSRLTDVGKFPNNTLGQQTCHITVSPTGNTGLFLIDTSSPDFLRLAADPGDSINVEYHIEATEPPNISGTIGVTTSVPMRLTEADKFGGVALADLICRILVSPTGNTGDFIITSSTPAAIILATDPGISIDVEWEIVSPETLSKTSTIQEIMLAAQAEGAATMIKGGQLFIDGIISDILPACKIILDPA